MEMSGQLIKVAALLQEKSSPLLTEKKTRWTAGSSCTFLRREKSLSLMMRIKMQIVNPVA
jgi:hypothetical protein